MFRKIPGRQTRFHIQIQMANFCESNSGRERTRGIVSTLQLFFPLRPIHRYRKFLLNRNI